jgi:hypothetical protein|uniref:hypothetical protein n=1 Tax=Cephaloticoccus sp. TaxID=1985742 RepID=UPI00404B71D4
MPAYRNSKHPKPTSPPLIPVKQAWTQDMIWGRPVFKAPSLPNPRTIFDPLPFAAARVTHRQTASAEA